MFLILPCVSALSISEVALVRNGGEISTINPTIPQTVFVSLLTDATTGSINADLSDLGGGSGSVLVSECESEGNSHRCLIDRFQITKGGTVRTWISVGGSSSEAVETEIDLRVDTQGPKLNGLRSDVCDDEQCYIGNEQLMNITITVEDGPIESGNFHYQLGSMIKQPQVCGPTGCRDLIRLTCRDGEMMSLRVLRSHQGITSSDDAGNAFTDLSNRTSVVCDAKAPEILKVTYNGTGPGGSVAQGSRLQVLAVVKDTTKPTISLGIVNLQENVSVNASAKGECKNMSAGRWACGVSVGNLQFGSNLLVPVTITDSVGLSTTRDMRVAQILQVANATEIPDLFSSQATSTMPSQINRVALDLALENGFELQHMISYNLRAKESGARVLHQRILPQTCKIATSSGSDPYRENLEANWSVAPALYSPLEIFNPSARAGVANRVQGSFLSADIAIDENIVMCNISLVVAKYNKVYAQEEMETLYWPLNFRNSKLGEPGGAFIEKIEKEKAKLNGGVNRILKTAKTITSTMSHVCQIQGVMNQATNQMVALEGIAMSMSFVPGMTAVQSAAGGTAGSLLTLTSQTWMGDIFGGGVGKIGDALSDLEGPIKQMCRHIHCDLSERSKEQKAETKTDAAFDKIENTISVVPNGYGAGDGQAEYFESLVGEGRSGIVTGELFSNLNSPNLDNSLYASMAYGCFPAVIHNLDKYRQIDCGYLQCLKEQALGGTSITPCEEARGAKMCTAALGEVFELPFVNIYKNLVGNINKLIQNSGYIATKAIVGSCPDGEINGWGPKAFACRIIRSVDNTKQFSSVSSYNAIYRPAYEQDLCAAVLCEGDACERTSGSYLERSFFPGYVGYTWPQRAEEERLLAAREVGRERITDYIVAQKAPQELAAEFRELKGKYDIAKKRFDAADEPTDDVIDYKEYNVAKVALESVEKDLVTWNQKVTSSRESVEGVTLNSRDSATQIIASAQQDLADLEDAAEKITFTEEEKKNIEAIYNQGKDTKTDAEEIAKNLAEVCAEFTLDECIRLNNENLKQKVPKTIASEMEEIIGKVESYKKWNGNIEDLKILEKIDVCKDGACHLPSCDLRVVSCAQRVEEYNKLKGKLDEEKKEIRSIDGVASICEVKDVNSESECIPITEADNLDTVGSAKKLANKEKMNDYLGGITSIGTQYAVSQGYFDVLTLGAWGSWGEKISGATSNVLDPEQWKANICNPRGDLSDLTKDQSSVYMFSRGTYRPVLTFAAERLELPSGEYLYTASTVIISAEYDVNATVRLGSEELGVIPIREDEQESRGFSIISPTYHTELCVQFTKSFPQAGKEKEYCREVRDNAYDRGAQVMYDFNYGEDNPWISEIENQDAITATALSTIGAVSGGPQ